MSDDRISIFNMRLIKFIDANSKGLTPIETLRIAAWVVGMMARTVVGEDDAAIKKVIAEGISVGHDTMSEHLRKTPTDLKAS